MSNQFEQFVRKIVDEVDCSPDEKEDIFEEMLTHLKMSREEFILQGFTQAEAEKKAIHAFGKEEAVSSELQHVLTPLRKELYLTSAIASLVWVVAAYLTKLFISGDAHFIWLTIAVTCGTALIALAILPLANKIRRRYLNTLLIIHLLVLIYEWLLTENISFVFSLPLNIGLLLIIGLDIFLIYQTTINGAGEKRKGKKLIHIIYVTTGFILCSTSLFFIYGGLIMIGSFERMMFIFILPVVIWAFLYKLQLIQWERKGKIVYSIALLPVLSSMLVLIIILFPAAFF